jgi:hypothetical protein
LTRSSTPATGAAWYAPAERVDGAPAAGIADDLADAAPAPVRCSFRAPAAQAGPVRRVGIVEPLPVDVAFSTDPADGPACTAYWVATEPAALASAVRTPVATRGGALPLAFVVRPDFETAPDADTDELGELRTRLHAAGIESSIVPGAVAFPPEAAVIPVLWGALTDAHVVATATRLAPSRPFAVMAAPDSPYAAWFEAAIYTVAKSAVDQERLDHFLRAFDQRRLDIGNPPLVAPPAERDVTALVRPFSGRCFVAVAATDGGGPTADRLGLPDLDVRSLAPFVPAPAGPSDAALALTGGHPYAFVHATGGLAANLSAVLLALRDVPIPLVVVASYLDHAYAATMRRIAGVHAVILTDADPACVDALYRHATLFVDASLRSRGLSRIVRAARAGAVPLVFAEAATARLLPPECTVTRTGVVDVRDAVLRLWHAPGRDALGRRVRAALGETLGAESSVAGAVQQFADALASLAGAVVPT